VTAYAVAGNVLGQASDTIDVRLSGHAQQTTPPPTTEPAATQPAAGPTDTGGPVVLATPRTDPQLLSNGGGIPIILYILGAVLLALGGGILYLLFRSPKGELYETEEEDEPGRTTGLGYPTAPRHAATVAPTAIMPAVRDAHDPRVPPGVDPWAISDATKEIPRR